MAPAIGRETMEQLLRWTFLAALVLAPVACWQRDNLPPQIETLAPLASPPLQTPSRGEPFSVARNGVSYQIEPLFDYELHGLVVSARQHDGERMLHERWNDHLNVADLCVVWGSNTQALDLSAFEFYNGQFTCFFRTDDHAAWQQFDPYALSNNHLLANDAYLRAQIDKVRVGDQIRLRGQLANYSHGGGFQRGTSTTRNDTGNGACETIYVRDLAILASMDNAWRSVFRLAWVALSLAGAGWLFGVLSGRFAHRV